MKKIPLILFVLLVLAAVASGGLLQERQAAVISARGSSSSSSSSSGGSIDLSLAMSAVAFEYHGTTLTLNKPTGTVDGNFLLAVVYSQGYAPSYTITPPSGWTQIGSTQNFSGEDIYAGVYYKRASSEGASWGWTVPDNDTCGVVWRITGVVASGDPEDATRYVGTQAWDGGTTTTWNAITTSTAGSAIIGIRTQNDASTVSSASMTERYDTNNKIVIIADTQASAGSSGSKSATESAAGQRIKIMIALKPE